jgi:hypothetical protein
LFVKKKDGSIWLCIYHREINLVTIKNLSLTKDRRPIQSTQGSFSILED